MPYFETGTQISFTAGDKVALDVSALQEQHIGIVGTQRVAGNVDAATVAMLNSFTQQNLADNATFIGQKASCTINYMRLSWNLNGSTVTDLVIGLVATIDKVPNNGQNLINAVLFDPSPLKYLLDQIPQLAYDAYIIGTPPIGTYHYVISATSEATQQVLDSEIVREFGSKENALAEFRNAFLANLQNATQQSFSEKGYTVNVVSAQILDIHWIEKSIYGTIYPSSALSVTYEVTLDSNVPFQNSPIAPLVLAAIILIIKFLIVAAVAVTVSYLIIQMLKSMVTKTWTSKQTTYGWVLNPNTGEWEYLPISTKEESGTAPDLGGETIFIIGAVIVIVAIMFMSGFRGSGTKK